MVNQYGSGGTLSVSMEGPYGSFGSLVKITEITLSADGWKNATSPFFQIATLDGVSVNSKVDLQPNATQIAELERAGTVLTAVNDEGVITIYAVGNKPNETMIMQASITEVVK